jgi:hypothetical protein
MILLLACMTIAAHVLAEEAAPRTDWRKVLAQTGLLPGKASGYGAAGLGYLEEQLGRKLAPEETALLKTGDDGAWKTHTDELISFDLPDHPLLKVDVLKSEEKPELRIVGGAVGTTDNSFQRVYRITFSDGVPYGLVLVTEAEWFDDGICLCGPIDLKTLVPADGTLLELSQLPGGNLKKFQALNSTHRAILFEWTHSAITQAAYARIGASLRFATPSPRSEREWIALSRKHGDPAERGVSWLRPDMPSKKVRSLMGAPDRIENDEWIYIHEDRHEEGGGWRTTMRLPMPNDALMRFGEDWFSWDEMEPVRGSRAWIEDTLEKWADEDDDGDPFKEREPYTSALAPEDLTLILSNFHRHAPKAGGDDWDFWCGVIADLARGGVKNPEAVELIVERSTETDIPQFQTRWVLELYERPELREFVHGRIRLLMEDENIARQGAEFGNLLSSLERGDADAEKLLRDALRHGDDKLRAEAAYRVDKLPRNEAREQLANLLSDKSEDVRRYAILNIQDLCTLDDKAWLSRHLESETSDDNRELMEEKINQLKPAGELQDP